MNEFRKLMESVERAERIYESWDVKAIAGIIFDEMMDEFSPVAKVSQASNEPYRAAVVEFGFRSGLYNPKTLDGSEIYNELIGELERLGTEGLDEDEYQWPIQEEKVDLYLDVGNSDAEQLLYKAAIALAKDGIEQAKGVWDEEGDGTGKFRTGAKTQQEYVNIAARKFMTPDYLRDISDSFKSMYDEAIEDELDEFNSRTY